MVEYNYVFYTEGNKCFVLDFLIKLSEKEQGKVKYYLDLLKTRGPMLREPYAKKLNGSIYELRPSFGNTEIRLFYFLDGNTAWFVHGIIKKAKDAFGCAIGFGTADEKIFQGEIRKVD